MNCDDMMKLPQLKDELKLRAGRGGLKNTVRWIYDISAIGINEGQIPGVLTTYCDDRNIPLFELAERFPLIDLSQIICQKLTLEKNSTATGIDTILSHVDDKAVLDAYVDEHIGRLLQADEMFLHRNTLNYRLKKISEILGCDFTSLDDCMKLKLAFTILRYCNGNDLCTVHKKHGL